MDVEEVAAPAGNDVDVIVFSGGSVLLLLLLAVAAVVLAIVPLLLVAEALFIGVIDVNNLGGDGDSDKVDAV
nr:13390_t:CDS:2 [Entrophospora candida]